jgi:hypothetical protein
MNGELRERAIENAMIRLGESEATVTITETVDATLDVLPPAITAEQREVPDTIIADIRWLLMPKLSATLDYDRMYQTKQRVEEWLDALAAGPTAEPGS